MRYYLLSLASIPELILQIICISNTSTFSQVGYVTTICFSGFLIRCVMVRPMSILCQGGLQTLITPLNQSILQMCLNAFDKEADLDVLNHPILNFFYYLVCLPVHLLCTQPCSFIHCFCLSRGIYILISSNVIVV